jgi:hypothetical protein
MLLLEEVSYDLGLSLPAAQVTANSGHERGTVAGTASSETVGLDVLASRLLPRAAHGLRNAADAADSDVYRASPRWLTGVPGFSSTRDRGGRCHR